VPSLLSSRQKRERASPLLATKSPPREPAITSGAEFDRHIVANCNCWNEVFSNVLVAFPLEDEDFTPDFEQKGVDMQIGLDMANFSKERSVDRIILVSGDTDCLPAMKHCRIAGLQIILISFPKQKVAPELVWHSDFVRPIKWP